MPHANFPQFNDFGRDRQHVVEVSGREVADIHFRHDEHHPAVFNPFVVVPEAPQHFDTTTFEIVQIVGVVDASLAIGFLIGDANLKRMLEQFDEAC